MARFPWVSAGRTRCRGSRPAEPRVRHGPDYGTPKGANGTHGPVPCPGLARMSKKARDAGLGLPAACTIMELGNISFLFYQ